MKSKNSPTLLLSVALAVMLWLVATLLEDDARWLPEVPDERIDVSLPAPLEDSDLKINTDVMSCEQAESEIVRMVDDARYCSRDDDCTLFDYGYPIQCLTSVAKDEITALRLEYRRYEQSCSYRVYYDCPSGEMQREAVCRNNHCEVDLVTDEVLKDLTLRHLGIEHQ